MGTASYLNDEEDAQLSSIAFEEGKDDAGLDDAPLITLGLRVPHLELGSMHGSFLGFLTTKVVGCTLTNLRQ